MILANPQPVADMPDIARYLSTLPCNVCPHLTDPPPQKSAPLPHYPAPHLSLNPRGAQLLTGLLKISKLNCFFFYIFVHGPIAPLLGEKYKWLCVWGIV